MRPGDHSCKDYLEEELKEVGPGAEEPGDPPYQYYRQTCGKCKLWIGDLLPQEKIAA